MLDARIIKRRRDFVIDVALALPERAAIGLFGASGAGKSSVLSCVAGIEKPDGGFVRLAGVPLFPPSLPLHLRSIGYLTQDANLFPHLCVADNVGFSLGGDPREAQWIGELRERLQLDSIWAAPAGRISGGQARRVALARMLARRPRLVLLDEPFAGLDRSIVRGLLADIATWQGRLGFSMIVVDHRPAILERLAPRAIVLEAGQVAQTGTWDDLRRAPATPLLRALIDPL